MTPQEIERIVEGVLDDLAASAHQRGETDLARTLWEFIDERRSLDDTQEIR